METYLEELEKIPKLKFDKKGRPRCPFCKRIMARKTKMITVYVCRVCRLKAIPPKFFRRF